MYRLEQMGERWFLTWGMYPLSDKRLLVIDEFDALPQEDFGKLTEARTTGVVKVARVKNSETNARVRLILLTNPASARTLNSYTYGIESLKHLFASPADIRRLDLAVMLQTNDVSETTYNKERIKSTSQLISSELIRSSILWAWSRKPEQINIELESLRAILRESSRLGKKYGFAKEVPIMEPSDLRKKLARLAIALAGLVHSTDEAHEKVIVKPEHVAYVVEYLEVVYDNRNCRLDSFSDKSRQEAELTPEERVMIQKELDDIDFSDNAGVSSTILDLFRRNELMKPNELVDMLGYDRNQVMARLGILTNHNMITRTKNGLRKLPKFIEFLDNA